MKIPKVLLGTPTCNHKSYCQADWIKMLKRITYKNIEFLIVDNSPDNRNSQQLEYLTNQDDRFTIHWLPFPADYPIYEKIRACTKHIVDYMKLYEYDYWFSLESDVFPCEPDITERLMAWSRPVVGATYLHEYANGEIRLLNDIVHDIPYIYGQKISTTMGEMGAAGYIDGQLKYGYMTGIGCMLFKKEVFDVIKIHNWIAGYPEFSRKFATDYFLHLDMAQNNIPILIDTSILPDHRNSYRRIVEYSKLQRPC